MAKTQWIILFATFIVACASISLLVVSITTTNWVEGTAVTKPPVTAGYIEVSYGLFTGFLTRRAITTPSYFDLTMTCLFEENICGYSCQPTAEKREDEIRRILNGQSLIPCITSRTARKLGQDIHLNESITLSPRENPNEQFINAGLWISTVLFLSITILFAFIAAFFSVLNVAINPVTTIFSVFGLYIWNGIAIGSNIITLILWGALFGSSITDNLAVTDTLTVNETLSSAGLADLGFSYWLLLCPIFLHIGNIGMLIWRQRIIEREPPPLTINTDKQDNNVFLIF